jgi:hypothetical protein
MIHYGILAPNRVGAPEDADWPLRADRRFRFRGKVQSPKSKVQLRGFGLWTLDIGLWKPTHQTS